MAPASPPLRPAPAIARPEAAAAGIAAAAVAMAASELVAAAWPGAPSLALAAGSLVIALQPPGAKDLAATLFGTNDKLALNLAVVVVAMAIAAGAGILAVRSRRAAAMAFAGFAALGFTAAVTAAYAPVIQAAVSAVTAGGAGLLALRLLLDRVPRVAASGHGDGSPADQPPAAAPAVARMPDWGRRRFLLTTGALTGGALGLMGLGRFVLESRHPAEAPVTAGLPRPVSSVPSLAADQSLSAPGLTPIVMPNDRFYRIDTALLVPQVDVATWKLTIDGMVDHPLTFRYPDLLAMPLIEQYVTIQCVSNEVGGDLVGNALWTGVRLKELLTSAGVQPAATQIVGRSVDGFTVGFPTAWAFEPDREPMVVVAMNREVLPAAHGFPARLIVPGLYGYVSATKWLTQIELTTREGFDAYWIPLGWAKDGPILTQSRIDHPASGERLAAGTVVIDGLAWAPDRGIARVEVSVDGLTWQEAQLSRAISKATWVQWRLDWQATAGDYQIEIRATDGAGRIQTAQQSPPAPDGARGHHRVRVTVA